MSNSNNNGRKGGRKDRRTGIGVHPASRLPKPPGSYIQSRGSLSRLPVEETLSFPVSSPKKAPRLVKQLISRAIGSEKKTRLYVIDTNVITNDPTCVFRFQEHDVCVPMLVLEELDGLKKQSRVPDDAKRNAREFSRILNSLVVGRPRDQKVTDGLSLEKESGGLATGRLYLYAKNITTPLPSTLVHSKVDNQILQIVLQLMNEMPGHEVVLVSKDINFRVKAEAHGLSAEDYTSDRVLEDTDVLYSGTLSLPDTFWTAHENNMIVMKNGMATRYTLQGELASELYPNQFVFSETGKSFQARVIERTGKRFVLETIKDYRKDKNRIFGIRARNLEQSFALNLLLDPEIDLVTLVGQAGSGKTLIALAAALEQVMERKLYKEIIYTRATIPVGEDIGFLPGTEEEKMRPWIGALKDNLEVLASGGATKHDGAIADEWHRSVNFDQLRRYIEVCNMGFMRGRTIFGKVFIIDECQNLTPRQVKTLVTRGGEGTKVICLGNLSQIDTPYLTEGSSGLTYLVERFKGDSHFGHILMSGVERSRLAKTAAERL